MRTRIPACCARLPSLRPLAPRIRGAFPRMSSLYLIPHADDGDSAVEELRKRFAEFSRTGDDSIIPADLVRTTYAAAVRYGGREEYDAMKKIHESPKNPTSRQAAMCVSPLRAGMLVPPLIIIMDIQPCDGRAPRSGAREGDARVCARKGTRAGSDLLLPRRCV